MRDTCAPSNNLPTPFPGVAASLLIKERPDFFCRTNSSSRRSGVPTPMKPPTMMLAPAGIIATASSTETALMLNLQSASDRAELTILLMRGRECSLDLGQEFPSFREKVEMPALASASSHSLLISL